MSEKIFMVIAYDISNDKRRTRLHKRLCDFGTPVQYSVFECLLSREKISELKAIVRKTIKPSLDHVRYYEICAACRQKIEVSGRKDVTKEHTLLVV